LEPGVSVTPLAQKRTCALTRCSDKHSLMGAGRRHARPLALRAEPTCRALVPTQRAEPSCRALVPTQRVEPSFQFFAPTHRPDPDIVTVSPMHLPEPTASGEWSPALLGLERLSMRWVVLVQLVVTILMVGMIWTVHVVHYELFPLVGPQFWDAYEHAHVDRIGKVLFGPWLIEGLCVLVLLLAHPKRMRVLSLVSAFLMLFILIDTAAFSAPTHGILLDHWDQQTYDKLMVVNLIRAWLWTAKGVVAVWMMVEVLRVRTPVSAGRP